MNTHYNNLRHFETHTTDPDLPEGKCRCNVCHEIFDIGMDQIEHWTQCGGKEKYEAMIEIGLDWLTNNRSDTELRRSLIGLFEISGRLSNDEQSTPRYHHECKQCTFLEGYYWLGQYFDLYYCKGHQRPGYPMVIARYSDQLSGYYNGVFEDHTAIERAKSICRERGLPLKRQISPGH